MRGQLDAKALRVIATYTDERVPAIGDVPTAKEQGVDLVVAKFRGILGHQNLPADVVSAWEDGIQKLMADPAFKAWYEGEGVQAAYRGQAEATAERDAFVASMSDFFTKYDIK